MQPEQSSSVHPHTRHLRGGGSASAVVLEQRGGIGGESLFVRSGVIGGFGLFPAGRIADGDFTAGRVRRPTR
jgi:hypothetical protein